MSKCKIKFLNAEKQHKKTPGTFYVPPKAELDKLKVDDIVKVCCSQERFWVIITKIEGDKITAKVDNELIFTNKHGLKYKDTIEFVKNNIYNIYADVE